MICNLVARSGKDKGPIMLGYALVCASNSVDIVAKTENERAHVHIYIYVVLIYTYL